MYKTTKKQFELFKLECNKGIKVFDLGGWNITFYHEKMRSDAWAECKACLDGRQMNLRLNIEPNQPITPDIIRKVALHECIHGVLARFSELAHSRCVTGAELFEAEEELVIKLIKVLVR